MSDDSLKQQLLRNRWHVTCESAKWHAEGMALICDQRSADLIRSALQKFVSQPAPRDENEMSTRHEQHLALIAEIGTIVDSAHAAQ